MTNYKDYKKTGDLICAALVREMYATTVWRDIKQCWLTLLHVREQQRNHINELARLVPHDGQAEASDE